MPKKQLTGQTWKSLNAPTVLDLIFLLDLRIRCQQTSDVQIYKQIGFPLISTMKGSSVCVTGTI